MEQSVPINHLEGASKLPPRARKTKHGPAKETLRLNLKTQTIALLSASGGANVGTKADAREASLIRLKDDDCRGSQESS